MNNARSARIAVLLTIAVAVGLLTPTFVPAAASLNSHSVDINPSSQVYPSGNFTLIISSPTSTPGQSPLETICTASISVLPTSTNATMYFTITIVPGSCHPANG